MSKEQWDDDWSPYEHAVNVSLGGKTYIAEAKKDYRTDDGESVGNIVKHRSECGCYIYFRAWLRWDKGEWIDLGWYNFQGLSWGVGDITLCRGMKLKEFVEEQYRLINKVA